MSNRQLYEQDFYAWANEQAGLLRAGQFSEADIEHIAEEIESMGRSEKRTLVSWLTILLLHLLKWQSQPSHRGASWRASVENARDDIGDHLGDSPSLRASINESMVAAYRRARRNAAAKIGLAEATFPLTCPEIMAPEFWPENL